MTDYVAYYRVSTQKQGVSGLGLLAQQHTVKNFIGSNNLIAEYTEIESGKNDKRAELKKAIERANSADATLVIAKLDRLSRNAGFIFQLRDTRVDFVCCDIPDANTMTIGIFALLAQQEREMISERTKKALKAKKDSGFALGRPENLTDAMRAKGREAHRLNALENNNNRRAYALIRVLRKQNLSYRSIAGRLNDSGFRTARGNLFYANSVRQVLALFEKA